VGAVAFFGAEFENQFANVARAAQGTPQELADLNNQLLELAKTQQAGGLDPGKLTDIATAGAQMGIAATDLSKFVAVVAQLSGNTGLDPGQAGEALGIIATLTHTSAAEFSNLGSTITDLGNKLNGGVQQIIDVTQRIAGAATALGLTKQQILGISGAIGAIGVEPEAGGTAIQRILLQITAAVANTGQTTDEQKSKLQEYSDKLTDLGSSLQAATERQRAFGRNTPASAISANAAQIDKYKREIGQTQEAQSKLQGEIGGGSDKLKAFADISGVTADQFKEMVKTDPGAAFQAVIHGLNRIQQGAGGPERIVEALDAAGINDARLTRVLIGLATGADEFDKSMNAANKAWADNTALAEGTAKKQGTVIQTLLRLKNTLQAIAIQAWPAFETSARDAIAFMETKVIPVALSVRDKFLELDPALRRNILLFAALAAVLGPVLFAVGLFVIVLGSLFSPLILIAAAVGVLAVAWATNWNNIRDTVGGAVETIIRLLNGDLSGALRAAVVIVGAAAVIMAAVLGNALGGLVVKFAAFATTWILQAVKVAAGWVIAAAPAVGLILAIAGVIVAVAIFRRAWDSNWNGIQEKVVPVLELIKNLDQAFANFQGFTPQTRAAFQSEADSLQSIIDNAKKGQATSPPSPLLDAGEDFVKQFQAGFPDLQKQIQAQVNGVNTDALGVLGVPTTGIRVAQGQLDFGPTLSDFLTSTTGTAVPTDAAFGIGTQTGVSPIPQQPVIVNINNPAVFDQAMLDQMQTQMLDAVTAAMVTSEKLTDVPPISQLPGQPLFGAGVPQ